jgi:Zn-dependent M28 family amino/carboxypeptidase
MRYDPSQPKIPVAAVSPEDAMMIARLYADGVPVRVRLQMGAQTLPDAQSANVIGEIRGRELPDEVVVIGGHIDSWDVGQGAQDDGAALMVSLQALALMKKAGLQPRRTLRVAFWANEENGSRGGEAYRAWAAGQTAKHVAAIEMDGGAETPVGFGAAVDEPSTAILNQIAKLLEPIGAGDISTDGGGEDIKGLMRDGVPGLAERTMGLHYFDWHHSEADTFDKVSLEDFRKNLAAMAVMSYVLADMPDRLQVKR